ncbi:MAG: hypothetical protein FJ088_03580, partial [Deltaproteobacteria bacterium]|nr:hypothetical protein [Deltaproteobacteria bacterium]
AQNGTALLNALAGITDASASNPYLLKIEPGVYSLGTGTLVMNEYVDIEGSGETVTKITALGKTSSTYGTVNFKNNSELRQLTVENTGGNSNAIAINVKSTTARISHVTAIASGGSSNTYGILVDSSSNAVLSHITASASGQASIVAGIALKYSTVSIIDAASTATATSTSTSWCYGVTFFASQGYASDIRASASGTYVSRLAGIYNYSIDSLTMNDITASVDASNDDNYGIYNENVSNVMMNVVIVVSNATMANYGLFNNSTSKPVINNLVVKVSGSSAIINYGIVFDTGSYPIINSSKITVSGATGASYGIASWGFNPRVNIADITVSGGAAQNFGIYSGGGSIFVNTARIFHNTSANFPVFRDVSISVSDGEYAYGVYNTVLSDIYYASFTNVYIDATQGSVMSYGMRNMDANVRVTNSTFDATSPYPGIGVSSTQSSGGPYTVTIDNSQIISNSSNATVENKNSCITRIGATKLEGGAATNSGGTLTCAGVHDENYAFYSSTCP